ncbi:Acetyltransferase (GNAT) domain-containing protein [Mesonia phycicola]|uniref:Acetyltransferase (GNAT) domain-containing protein n=1 Tax=Mesonia phycicola TaxID=579105 RepID=A0A1M6A1D4_9FLAO|nr:GNAT family N-acetyltransferase [Mesonia phycicola]SHI30245.1 Acetyltransferase (GNAT) domain-containing protein [Mesonia phycicola]
MIKLESFKIDYWKYLKKWISSESELVQFAGQIFSFPIDKKQVELYLSESNRTVFKIENENNETIGIAEINIPEDNVAKLARILIGEKSMRGKGIGTELINKLTEYGFYNLKKERIILNVYSWNI